MLSTTIRAVQLSDLFWTTIFPLPHVVSSRWESSVPVSGGLRVFRWGWSTDFLKNGRPIRKFSCSAPSQPTTWSLTRISARWQPGSGYITPPALPRSTATVKNLDPFVPGYAKIPSRSLTSSAMSPPVTCRYRRRCLIVFGVRKLMRPKWVLLWSCCCGDCRPELLFVCSSPEAVRCGIEPSSADWLVLNWLHALICTQGLELNEPLLGCETHIDRSLGDCLSGRGR